MKKFLSLIAVALAFFANSASAQKLTVNNIEMAPGGDGELVIGIDYTEPVWSLEFNIEIPAGITADFENAVKGELMNNDKHKIELTGTKLMMYPGDFGDYMFAAASGTVAKIPLKADADVPEGVLEIKLTEISAANDEGDALPIDDMTIEVKIAAGEPEPGPDPDFYDKQTLTIRDKTTPLGEFNFWVHEWRTADAQTDGPAKVVGDAVKVYIRSKEQAAEAGNATLTDAGPLKEDFSNFADWDSQFFISIGEENALKVGDKLKVSMKVKADKAATYGTQSHAAPGAYIYWACLGDVEFPEDEFATFEKEVEVVEGEDSQWGKMYNGGIPPGTFTIAFNLAKGIENTIYVKDVNIEVIPAPNPFYAKQSLIIDGEESALEESNFWVHEWRTADAQTDGPAEIVDDAIKVYIRSKEQAAEAGNATLTDAGPLKEDFSNFADWDSQFFISIGEENALSVGDKLKVTMQVKADKAATYGTQSHAAPGAYIYWACLGDVEFPEDDFATFEKEVEVVEGEDSQWGKMYNGGIPPGTYTVAFNLAKGDENAIYVKDVKIEVTHVATGIKSLETAKKVEGIYNLAGQKVDKNYKGIVIVNGKKMMMK